MGPFLHRLIAALLVLAFATPSAAVCGPVVSAADPMSGMSCCEKLPPSDAGSMERDCCRMNEQLPEQVPAAPLPPRTNVQVDSATTLVAIPVSIHTTDTRAHFDIESARGRPVTPTYLRTTVLLI
ncbi:MAG TPA: hypothetical protein VF147_14655 [Vicinamibacterales bacterium]